MTAAILLGWIVIAAAVVFILACASVVSGRRPGE